MSSDNGAPLVGAGDGVADATGKILKSVPLSGKGAGMLTLDANTLAAGAYHYSLYVDDKLVGTKQMVLLR